MKAFFKEYGATILLSAIVSVVGTINSKDEISSITYYDNKNKRNRQVDLTHKHNGKNPHTHHGYIHDENGTTNPTTEERQMIDRVKKLWYNISNKPRNP